MSEEIDFIAYLMRELFAFRAKAINVRVINYTHTEVLINSANATAGLSANSNFLKIDEWKGREKADLAYNSAKLLHEQLTLDGRSQHPGPLKMHVPSVGLYVDPSIFKTPFDVMMGFIPELGGNFILVLSVRSLQKQLQENKQSIDEFYNNIQQHDFLSALTKRVM